MRCGAILLAAAVAAAAASPSAARADAKAADKAFRKGKKLLEAKQYEEACAAFETSFREDPAIGAQLNVARCYQEWDKFATALEAYQEALRLASSTGDDRAPQIRELVQQLTKQVPKLVLSLPKGRLAPPGLAVTLDGAPVSPDQLGTPILVNAGTHEIVTRSADVAERREEVRTPKGRRTPYVLPIDAPEPAVLEEEPPAEPPPPPTVAKSDPGASRRLLGLGVGGAGVIGLGVATFLAFDARSDYRAAVDAHCDPSKQCDPQGLAATSDARSKANTATIIGGVALAAAVTGAILYFTAPSKERRDREARYVRPALWRDGGGLIFGGAL